MMAVVGFVIASVLCGIAQSLVEIVAFRFAAGVLRRGARSARPVRSARHLYGRRTRVRHGRVRRVGDVGPVLGPVIGGWLTDHYSWRWVFYINVPLGVLAFAGISFFLSETKTSAASEARLARIWQPEPGHCRHAGISGPRRATRLFSSFES